MINGYGETFYALDEFDNILKTMGITAIKAAQKLPGRTRRVSTFDMPRAKQIVSVVLKAVQ
jgi:hypothetical protein